MPAPERLLSLDALRGATIAAMIVVNTPGSWSAVYPPLLHANWHGLTPTDLIFPFFLFIVGVSVALAYHRALARPGPRPHLHRRLFGRAARIFAVGLLLNLWPEFDWSELRVAGVLQRIALVFAAVALAFLHLRWRGLLVLTLALLLGYWGLLARVPVPRDAVIEQALQTGLVARAHGATVPVALTVKDARSIEPNLEPGTNLAAWFDRLALPGRFYEVTWDPEGLLSTLPSIATALLGVLTGMFLLQAPALAARLVGLTAAGALLLALGLIWSTVLPLNKNLWTSSFVLVAAGWTLLLFAAALLVVDGAGWRRPALPALVFGANAITAYVLAGMLTTVFHRPWFGGASAAGGFMALMERLGASPPLASLLTALAYAGIVFIPVYVLYRRRILLRL